MVTSPDTQPVDSPDVATTDAPDGRPRRLMRALRLAVLSPWEILMATAVFAGAFGIGALITWQMLSDGQIGAISPEPLWDKVAYSYAAILLFFAHIKLLRRARDADQEVAEQRDTPVGRGQVLKGDLDMLAVIIVAVEGAVLANVGEIRLSAWAAAVVFSVLMRVDFFIPTIMRARPMLRSVLHGLVYGVVVAMLVGLMWEAGIGIGLHPIVLLAATPGAGAGSELPGLGAIDLLTVQPLLLALGYLCGIAWGMARELGEPDASGAVSRPIIGRAAGVVAAALAAWLVATVSTAENAMLVLGATLAGLVVSVLPLGWLRSRGADIVVAGTAIGLAYVGADIVGWM